jgi:hypothetical protein
MRLFENRTLLTIGFDVGDASATLSKGPDSDNLVWIGRRYNNRLKGFAG